jgi:hypothetical protein
MSKWFTVYKLLLNLDKMNMIKLTNSNTGYKDKYVESESVNAKFTGLQIDNHLRSIWIPYMDTLCILYFADRLR